MRTMYGLRLLGQPRGRAAALVVLAVLLVAFRLLQLVILSSDRMWAADFAYYWTAGQALLHGASIYSPEQLAGPYVPEGQSGLLYPPVFAVAMLPFAWVFPDDPGLGGWVWAGAGAVILATSVIAVVRSEQLDRRGSSLPRPRAIWFVVAALTLPPVIAELSVGNVHLELVGLYSLAWLGIRRNDNRGEMVAGTAVGIAALIKIFPGVLLLWFLITGRRRAATWTVATGAALLALSIPVTGLQPWLDYPLVLANMGLILDAHDSVSPTLWLASAIGFDAARWLVTIGGIALLGWAARARPTANSFAIAVAVSVLISPAVFHHYLSILVLPLLLAISAGVPFAWVGLSYVLLYGGQQPALGDWSWVLSRVPQTVGWSVLLIALAREGPSVAEPAASAPQTAAASLRP